MMLLFLVSGRPAPLLGGMVTNCTNDNQLAELISTGGLVTFNCGGVNASATILFTATRTISNGLSVTIDGGGKITFSGNNARRMFIVDPGGDLTLRNMGLTAGKDFGGGAVLNNGSLTVDTVKLTANHASGQFGGAIKNIGSLTVMNSEFSNNVADTGYGGAIDSAETSSLVTVSGSSFNQNAAALAGGAIANNGTVIITTSTFNGNRAGSTYGGGAIENTGPLTVSASTFSGNTAGKGGAIYNEGGTALIQNSTLSGNSANLSPRLGGGIHNQSGERPGNLTLVAGTLNANTAPSGSGGNLSNDNGSTLRVKLSIIAAGNPANCFGSLQSGGSNLATDTTCSLTSAGDKPDSMVSLAVLAYNGGLTQTHALLPGTAAVDAVAAGQCNDFSLVTISTDQRGIARPADGDANGIFQCDIGAFELSGSNSIATATRTITPTATQTITATRTSTPTHTAAAVRTSTPTRTSTFGNPPTPDPLCALRLCRYLPWIRRDN